MTGLVDNFMKILGDQPLSLALCAMNFLLLYFLFKQGNDFVKARGDTAQLILQTQAETQEMLANCVNKDIMQLIISALERDRETYRAMLPTIKQMPQHEP